MSESEDVYRTLILRLPAFTYIVAYEKERPTAQMPIYFSPQAVEVSGYAVEEWLADTQLWAKIIHPEDQGRVVAETWRTTLEDVPYLTRYRIVRKDGTIAHVLEKSELAHEATRDVWYGLIIEIGERESGLPPAE